MRLNQTLIAAAVVSLAAAGAAHAATAYALTDNNALLGFDTATPSSTSPAVFHTRPTNPAIQDIIGIDFRPATNTLYGVGNLGAIYTINPLTGVSTQVSTLSTSLNGSRFGFDFNPTVDRLRITSDADQNLRVNVDTGAATIDGSITNGTANANLVAAAYTNNFAGATTTQLYAIDTVTDQLYLSSNPNGGTYSAVGSLGFDATALSGFDIVTVGGVNQAFAALLPSNTSGSKLYSINLTTGLATQVGTIGGGDFADGLAIVVPEPTSLAAFAGMGLLALRRRQRA